MCWYVHTIINEALKRLFVRHYLQGSEQFISNLQCLKGTDGMKENIFNNVITLLTEKYQQLKKERIRGRARENSAVLVDLHGNGVQISVSFNLQ